MGTARDILRSVTPQLTPEQRDTLDAHGGQPVYVVDAERHETFVLLSSSDFDKVKPLLSRTAINGSWTDQKNNRRVELIDKRIVGSIAPDELLELAELQLQEQAEGHFDSIAPPPMQGVQELHHELLRRG